MITEYKCSLCGGPMTAYKDATGVMLRCENTPCDPHCHETVFGHGKNERDAWETACEKFKKGKV